MMVPLPRFSLTFTATICLAFLSTLISSHTVITYPGQRGNNLHQTGNVSDTNGLGEDKNLFPFGMQWMYPCGGMPLSTNRSLWPINGGAVGFQPGWFPGHKTAFVYINMGINTNPLNYSLNIVPVFEIVGPTDTLYNGSVCLPQVPLPANYTPKIGDNATIQVVEAAQHGAALMNCADITFADPKDVPEVNDTNCVNTTNISFDYVFGTAINGKSFALPSISRLVPWLGWMPLAAAAFML